MKNKQEKDFEALSGVAQILARPQMWIGSMSPVTQKMFVIGTDGVEFKEVTFIPAFRKILFLTTPLTQSSSTMAARARLRS